MKITKEKEEFRPVTIILEEQHEVIFLIDLLRNIDENEVSEPASNFGGAIRTLLGKLK